MVLGLMNSLLTRSQDELDEAMRRILSKGQERVWKGPPEGLRENSLGQRSTRTGITAPPHRRFASVLERTLAPIRWQKRETRDTERRA